MILADFLSEHGIVTYCTGGRVVEYPGILGGPLMLDSLAGFNIDIAFFSSTAFNLNGKILTVSEGGLRKHKTFRKHAKQLVYLCGSDKFDKKGEFVSMTLDEIDYFISDGTLPDQLTQNYKNTVFISTR